MHFLTIHSVRPVTHATCECGRWELTAEADPADPDERIKCDTFETHRLHLRRAIGLDDADHQDFGETIQTKHHP
jgi:hypothetical protein